MSFANKKGITVASGFKLQAESPIDARFVVDTIAERDELVSIKAAYPGLDVFVKATSKKYMYNGTSWTEVGSGAAVQADWAATDTNSAAYIKNKPSSMKASGGNADTVNNHKVEADVPANAVFTDTKPVTMKGATADAAGTAGYVPAPQVDERWRFLRGDGKWVPSANVFVGATAEKAGVAGLVPTPVLGATGSLLCSDGTWAQPMTTAEIDAICV